MTAIQTDSRKQMGLNLGFRKPKGKVKDFLKRRGLMTEIQRLKDLGKPKVIMMEILRPKVKVTETH
jgi:hypothetical protein